MGEFVIEGADQLRVLAAKLRRADAKTRRELVASLRPEVKKVTGEVQETVRNAPSEGRRGRGHERRAARALARSRRISDERAETVAARTGRTAGQVKAERRAKQAAKAEAGAGLRDSIAGAVSGSISTGNKTTGVSVTWRVRASKMPNSQRRLPRDFNREKGWRHPVFGNRENWVAQRGTPFFDPVIKRHQSDLEDRAVDGLQKAAEAILHEE